MMNRLILFTPSNIIQDYDSSLHDVDISEEVVIDTYCFVN